MKMRLFSVHCSIQVLAARRFLPAIAIVLLACLAAATVDHAHGANLLSNGLLDATSISSQANATPTGWTVAAFRAISGPFNDGASSEGFANFAAPGGEGLFFKPFTGNATDGDVTVHLYQDNPGTPGTKYTLTGYAGAEANYSGLIPGSRTKSEFAIEFLNAGSSVIGGLVLDLVADGLAAGPNFGYAQHMLMATAPAGTVSVRARASMIDAFNNPAGGGQAFVVDVFELVPTPATNCVAGVTWTPRESNRNWRSVASSADGSKLVAVAYNGLIYTSTDSGETWTPRESNRGWYAVASSADGSKLVAVVQSGQIYTSTDSGVTWTPRESNRQWHSVASSADGNKLVATVANGGQIYTSTDSGVTWTPRESNRNWQPVASSADGSKLVAAVYTGQIYTSTDSGVTWTPRESNRTWGSVASSADGSKLVAVVSFNGRIYTSVCAIPSQPVITQQPQSLTVTQGQTATFTVTATGSPPLSYKWQFEGTNLSGATNALFTIASAEFTNAGGYSVVVTNFVGSVTSQVAVLTVEPRIVEADAENPGYVRGQIVLKFTAPVGQALRQALAINTPFAALPFPADIQALNALYLARGLTQAHPGIGPTDQGLENIFLLDLNREGDMEQAAAAYALSPDVVWAAPHRIAHAFLTPNDQFFPLLWGMANINAGTAWNSANGSGFIIAVNDSGVDYTHCDLDLAANIWTNPGETGGGKETNGIDDDSNGRVDDVRGWDFYSNDNTPLDQNGHGTHVAGIIAAVGNNTEGVIGLAYGARIMPLQGLNGPPGSPASGKLQGLLDGIIYAVKNGAQIINNSWGALAPTPDLWTENVVDYAYSQGVLVVAAAGNSTVNACGFSPARCENSVTVTAVGPTDALASYSNFGTKADVAAPGGAGVGDPALDILSTIIPTYPGAVSGTCGKYVAFPGTSMAAPHVSALAALIWQQHPTWTLEEVKQVIRQSSSPFGLVSANGFDTSFGYGRIDAAAAVAVTARPPVASLTLPRNCDTITGNGPAVDAVGTVGGLGFDHYVVQIAPGVNPVPGAFATLISSTLQVNNGVLFPNLQQQVFVNDTYTLRVLTFNASGQKSEDRNEVNFIDGYITSPTTKQILTASSVPVLGVVPSSVKYVSSGTVLTGNLINYTLSWRPVGTVTPTVFFTGTTAVPTPGALANWPLGPVSEGEILLELVANYGGSQQIKSSVTVIVDKLLKPGWPVTVNHSYTFKSPMAADLDGDGTKEIIYGASVFEPNGTLRPGWDNNPGFGRSNPAVLDVNGDGKLEVIAAPNVSGVVVYCYPHNNKFAPLWSFTPPNPWASGNNQGIPSSISAGDVDGDGLPEIVFTVYFFEGNPGQTAVFAIDALTGTPKYSATVPYVSYSTVALANLDAAKDPDLEMVVTSSSNSGSQTTVLKRSGLFLLAMAGWPNLSGHGGIDPVVADVDHNGQYDILVGEQLWRADGTAFPGWPAGSLNRSTGALAPLCDDDCELEIILSAGNGVVWAVVDESNSLQFLNHNGGENHYVLMFGENGAQGATVVADITGDECPEVVRPPELGYSAKDVSKLYASASPQFPRIVCNPEKILRSTALVDDVDGDGKTDVLIAASGKIFFWNLGQTHFLNPKSRPWPMFQHDLRHTGTIPFGGDGSCDLLVEDTPYNNIGGVDTGLECEPNMVGKDMWLSRAIWVRNNCDGLLTHQNPEYGQPNCIYAKIFNRGCKAAKNFNVKFYYAKASTGLAWPGKWNYIGQQLIPLLPPQTSINANIVWAPPEPNITSGEHYCLLVRIISDEDPMSAPETMDVNFNTRYNNNIAWRNVNIVDLLPNPWLVFNPKVHNLALTAKSVRLEFNFDQDFLATGGRAYVNLGPSLFARWQSNGLAGVNVGRVSGTTVILSNSPAIIDGLMMDADEEQTLTMTIGAPQPMPVPGDSHVYNFDLVQIVDGERVGGISYAVTARGQDRDTDGDGTPDVADTDDDNDGIADLTDSNPLDPRVPRLPGEPACPTPPESAYVFRAGINDRNATPFDTATRSECLETALPTVLWKSFDDPTIDRGFGHTFSGLPAGIVKAELRIVLKPFGGGANNDSLNLGLNQPCAMPSFAWGAPIRNLPEAGGTWTANPLTVFTLDLAQLPTNGTFATNIVGKLATDRSLDVYLQDDTQVDYLELRVRTCPPPLFAFGLAHEALGQAQLRRLSDGTVVLTNLGASGFDGVRIDLQNADAWDLMWEVLDTASLPTGASLTLRREGVVNGLPNMSAGTMKVTDAGTLLDVSFDFRDLGASTYTVEIRRQGQVLVRQTGLPFNAIAATIEPKGCGPRDSPCCSCDPPRDCFTAYLSLTAMSPVQMTVPGYPTVLADEVHAEPEGIVGGSLGARQAVYLLTENIPMLLLTSAAIQEFDHLFHAVGQAKMLANSEAVGLADLGTNGQDGVNIILGQSGDTTVGLAGLLSDSSSNLWTGGVGSWLEAAVTGSFNGVPNQSLGSVRFTLLDSNSAAPYGITADFNAINSPSQRIVVRSNGVDVAVFNGHTGPVGSSSNPPLTIGKTFGQTKCITGDFEPGTLFVINGQQFRGDELLILAEPTSGHVDYHSEIALRASGLPEFTISGVQSAFPCTPNAVLNIALNGSNVVISWSGTGYRLEAATDLANPSATTVWSNVSGTSPVTLPTSGPHKFFRLICP